VLGVFSTNVHDSEIVYYQGKFDGAPLVRPEAMCVWHRAVSMLDEPFDQKNVGEEPRLGEAIHSFINFNVEVPILSGNMLI
jgi:hypothetical protein